MKSQWWYASPEFPERGLSRLTSPTQAGSPDWQLREAQKLSITIDGAWVFPDEDGLFGGDNDLVITSRHQFGERPIVDKLHYYQQEVPAPTWVGALFHPLVFASADFRADELETITLEVAVYDEDALSDEVARSLQDAMASGTQAAAIAFPVLAPFAGLATQVLSGVMRLIDQLDDHDRIVEGRIQLSASGPPGQGRDLLQPGFLVCFAEEVEGDGLLLDQRRRVCQRAGEGLVERRELSYLVLRVGRTAPRTPDMIVDQRAATLLGELQRGKGDPAAQSLRFVRETLDAYTAMHKLGRFRELAGRTTALSADETRLLDELRADPAVRSLLQGT